MVNRDQLCDALRSRWYLTTEEIDAIIADRDFFQPYLRDALTQRARLGAVPERPIDATDSSAIFLLTEMRDTTIIPDLLQCLRMEEDDVRLIYGDSLTEHMWITFAKLGHNHLQRLWEFVSDTTADEFARGAAVSGVVAMHHFHPEMRAAAVDFVERLLIRTDCFPMDHLASILCSCADNGLTELADPAEEFAQALGDKRKSQLFLMATADDVRKAFREGPRSDSITGRASDVYGVNRQWQQWDERSHDVKQAAQLPDCLKGQEDLVEKVRHAAASLYSTDPSNGSIENVRNQFELSNRLATVVKSKGELEQLEEFTGDDVVAWLLALPFDLARFGLVDEAVKVAQTWAAITERENFLGDVAVILAEAGREKEAHEKIEEALSEFPDDIWIRIKVGDAYRALGDLGKAEVCYRHALTMEQTEYDRDGVLERLIPLLEETGRSEEAAAQRAEEHFFPEEEEEESAEEPYQPQQPIVRGPKVGRNDPCPCGSGKKYKKCHGK